MRSLKDLYQVTQRIKVLNQQFKPTPKQKEIITAVFKSGKKRILLKCGRSFGKSFVCEYIAGRTACHPNKSVYVVGPDRKQQRRIMWDDGATNLQRLFPIELQPNVIDTQTTIKFPWGSFISVDGSENFDSYRGVPYDLMILDEGRMIDWRFYDASYPNLSKKNGVLIIISSAADNEENPFEQKYQEVLDDPDWFVMDATAWDNPYITDWLTVEKAKYIRRGDIVEWMLEYENVRMTGGKRSLFPMFSRRDHVRPLSHIQTLYERDKQHLEYWTVFDPGSQSVFGVLFCALNRITGQVYILDEIYEKDGNQTTTRRIWERVFQKEKSLYPGFANIYRVYDEAAAWFEKETVEAYNIGMIATTKASRSKEDDISIIKDTMLSPGHFLVAETCQMFIKEVTAASRDENGEIKDGFDHLLDDLRYFFRMSHFSLNVAPLPDNDISFKELKQTREFEDSDTIPMVNGEVEIEEDADVIEWEDSWN